MENSGEDGDDQGWLEVKKRHRSSSKLSVQSNIGGFPNKTHSSFGRSQSSSEVKIINGSLSKKSLPRKSGRAFSNHEKMGIKSLSSSSKEDNSVICLEKQGINQENKLSKLHVSESIKVADSEEGTRSGQEVLNKVDLDKTPKIKWGDLEDEVLDISIVANNSMSNVSYNNVHPEQKLVINSDDDEKYLGVILSSAVQEEPLNENCKEVNEISSEPVELSIADEKMESLNDVGGTLFTTCNKSLELSCKEANDAPCSSDPLGDACFSSGTLDISEFPSTSQVTTTEVGALESMRFPHEKGSTEASGDDFVAYAVENGSVQENLGDVNLSKRQLVTALEEGESGESKERFRERLWCFLFENLNRAVDELYLLCELECDVEQMKEAILVLEEAGSDFKELESRVEGFDKLKRSSSKLSQDGAPANVNTDYRRPHALSWEVRRMTTSPHRAEILSSSLEAFKKVQQEMASKLPLQDPKGLMRTSQHAPTDLPRKSPGKNGAVTNARELGVRSRKQTGVMDLSLGPSSGEKRTADKLNKGNMVQSNRLSPQNLSDSSSLPHSKEGPSMNKEKVLSETKVEKIAKYSDSFKRSGSLTDKEKEKEKRNAPSWKSMNAWKEKRNWEDILASPLRTSSRVSHSTGMSRKSAERARVLHDKLMSPEKKKKTALDMKREAEEKHARAMRIRSELENERVQRLQRTSEKLNRVSEWQNMRSLKLREGMFARHQRSESRHEAHLAQVVRRAGDESSKVNEVRFITSLNEENKKIMLRQKLHDSELRRAEKLQVIKTKQKEDCAREEAVLERRKLLEAEKLQRLAETQRKKEEAQVRREEERKASSAAREARAMEQLRRKEVRAKAQQEEAELLAQKLAERLSESETRRKFYLEQIRDRASMDFRDQSSPSIRRSSNKDGPGKLVLTNSVEDFQTNCSLGVGTSVVGIVDAVVQQSLKRRIKKIRQKLMAMKYEFAEPPVGADIAGIGYRTQVGVARAKIGRWLQDLQRLRQARKEGAASLGLIVCDMIKFLEGKDLELHVSRQVGLLDFIASALPASHTPKPENCQVTMSLLRLLRVLLSVPANRSYFISQNLLPPIIPMLSAALENYIKIAASSNLPLNTANLVSGKTSLENMESIAEVMEGFLWTVATTIGHICSHEGQIQMQNGLTELVVAYQVVHRLRDLFALFDRPQLEGSPFPSFILLSLNLLAVLTSWSGNVSYIDWGFYLTHSTSASNSQEAKPAEAAKLVDELCGTKHDEPLSDLKGPENIPSKTSIGVDKSEEAADESQRSRIKEHVEASFSQRDDNSKTYNTCAEQNINVQRTGDTAANKKTENGHGVCLKQPIAFLVSAVVETGLVSLPSLLTAVLLQANSKMSSEQGSYVLPSNFEEVATGVLKVLNNLALLDINLLQRMLARPDLKMEFFHLMSFLLSHCTSKWKAATDQVGFLLLETLLLLGYFALFHPGNQAVLRWGKSPTILHKVCDLPFVFFSDPELTPILAGTLVAACYGCEQNKGVVQQELSMEMLLSLLKSCRQGLGLTQSEPSPPENNTTNDDSCDGYQSLLEPRKLQNDSSVRSTRNYPRSSRASLGKGVFFGSNARVSKTKNQRDSKATKTCDEWALTHNLPASEVSSTFMLHSRFPSSFIDRAEEFFSIESV